MKNKLKFEILSLGKTLFSGYVESITAPGKNGIFQVFFSHADFLSSLKEGEIIVRLTDSSEKIFPIKSGFFEISNNNAIVLIGE